MDDKSSKRIREIVEPSTLLMAKLSRELREKGFDIISLSLGEPDFETPEHIRKAAIYAIENGFTHYPPVAGYADVRDAIAQKLKRDNRLEYSASQILVSTGAKQSIINVMLSVLDEGDEIIVPSPFWVSYPEMAKMAGAKAKYIHTTVETNYKINSKQLEEAITNKTKAFVFSSPCNPTGSVYSKEELVSLAEIFRKNPHVLVISDEIYEYIDYTGNGHISIAEMEGMKDQTAVINGLSKGFAMTGWRIGYMAGPQWLVNACEKIQGQFTSGACSISERATLAAMEGDMKPTQDMISAFTARRKLAMKILDQMPNITYNAPEGAFYLFPNVSKYFNTQCEDIKVKDADDLVMYLLKAAQVSTVSGTGFGEPNCIRISYALSIDLLETALNRVKTALANLRQM